jgi:KaiC/GvpD/RAD55 family RecA-like ATPase
VELVFEQISTGIDGLDAILGGGIRYPKDTAAFVFLTGQAGTGKTLLGLEILTRAWWKDDQGGRTFLFYSVEQSPADLHKKLLMDFGSYFGAPRPVEIVDDSNPRKLCLEIEAPSGGRNRLVLTQANPASSDRKGFDINIEWIQAEIGNYGRAAQVGMVCIDNVGLLLNDLDYFDKRGALLRTRNDLMHRGVHGIFIHEESAYHDSRFPTAEELSTDVLIQLAFQDGGHNFRERTIEVLKARHQYYYRGKHHFSIAGMSKQQELVLGARGERGPGAHLYASVPAQLSIARDESSMEMPPRGEESMPFGFDLIDQAFEKDSGPTALSSSIVLAEPGTRYTSFALRWLAAGLEHGDAGVCISTKEDPDAIRRICWRVDKLAALRKEGSSKARSLNPKLGMLYLHPEFITSGKFVSDIVRVAELVNRERNQELRLAFDNISQLGQRFPLLKGQDFLIPAMLDILRYKRVTPLFIDIVPPGVGPNDLNYSPARQLTSFDNVFHLFLKEEERDGKTVTSTHMRILKSVANDFDRSAFPLLF